MCEKLFYKTFEKQLTRTTGLNGFDYK